MKNLIFLHLWFIANLVIAHPGMFVHKQLCEKVNKNCDLSKLGKLDFELYQTYLYQYKPSSHS